MTRRCGGDFAAQGGFSHSHLCRYYATTWYLRPGVPQSVDGTSLPSSSSLADALPSPPPPPSLLLLPPSPTLSSSSTHVLSVKRRTTAPVYDKLTGCHLLGVTCRQRKLAIRLEIDTTPLSASSSSSRRPDLRNTKVSPAKREGDRPGLFEDAAVSSSSATTWMYTLLDEGDLLSDSGGIVENDDTVVAAGNGTCVNDRILHYHQHPQQHPHQQQHSPTESELHDLLQFRGTGTATGSGRQEMVAQDMAEGYTQLLYPAAVQEPQEFISLQELQPRIHRQDTCAQIVSSASQLYHHQQRNGDQQRNYYNLSSVQESSCSTVYFGEINTGSGVGELTTASAGGGGEGLAPTPTPANGSNSSGSSVSTTTPSSLSTATTTTTTSTTSIATILQVATGAEPPRHMETPPTMVPDQQAPASGHHYHHHHHHHHHRHHRSTSTTSHEPTTNTPDEFARKRKLSCHAGSDLLDDLRDDAKSIRTNDDSKKQNHSEIEKRRRDKMNTYITELSAMVPMCHAMSRKLDKLTVLRMAVQHLKTILGAVTSYTEGHYKPAFLSDQELKTLILQAAEGFVFVVGCDRGRILYVSESVSQTLNYSQGDLLGQSWFDILHPKDVAKVKEQLSSSDLSPRERLIDAKTMLPVKTDVPQGVSRLCPGARRSFFCRMKRKIDGVRCDEMQVKEEVDTTTGCHRRKKQQNVDRKYCVIQCTGYLKSWAPAKIGLEEQEGEADGEACNLSCLIAVGRVQMAISTTALPSRKPHLRPIQFVSRHAMDGKFLFVDQRATPVLGFLPQELLGTSMYEYYHHDDIPHLAESHKAALQTPERITTQIYRFRSKDANFVRLQSEWKSFRNPWTKDIEYLIAKNSAIFCDALSGNNGSEDSSVQDNYDYFTQSNDGLERLISSHVEVSKIGRQIAEEVLDLQKRGEDSSSGSSPGPAVTEPALLNTESQITTTTSPERVPDVSRTGGIINDNCNNNPTSTFNHVANNVQLNSIANDQGASPDEDMMDMIGGTAINESPNPIPSDGNDEAAMAVIMSLLEADAGLGGPVDFSGLPWPLP